MRAFLSAIFFLLLPIFANDKCSFSAKVHRISPSEVILGITLTPVDKWHTYWSNPGEAGLALSIELEDAGVKVLADDFPVPSRYEFSGIVTYGYSKAATFLYSLSGEIPEQLKGTATWLVCDEDSCLPADAVIDLKVSKKIEETTPEWLTAAQKAQPEEKEVKLEKTIAFIEGQASYIFTSEKDFSGWTVYPYDNELSELPGKTLVESAPKPAKTKALKPEEKTDDAVVEESEPAEESDDLELKVITGPTHKISFKVVGDLPEAPSFLLTKGDQAYKISL